MGASLLEGDFICTVVGSSCFHLAASPDGGIAAFDVAKNDTAVCLGSEEGVEVIVVVVVVELYLMPMEILTTEIVIAAVLVVFCRSLELMSISDCTNRMCELMLYPTVEGYGHRGWITRLITLRAACTCR